MAKEGPTAEAERLLEEAGDALDRGEGEEALDLAARGERAARRAGATELLPDLILLQASALNDLGRSREALSRADELLRGSPRDTAAMLERAFALWELVRLPEARSQLQELLQMVPDDAWGHHLLGLVAERLGDAKEARRRFSRARRLDPGEFPEPVHLSQEDFDKAVEDALEGLPAPVRGYLSNVAIAVEDLPADDDLLASDPPLSPAILGIFRGSPFGEKGSMDPWSHFPSSIVLYQKNLERAAADRAQLIEQIGVTLVHEVGHFLGLDEEELWERGLD
jgi:predicted Zn-dependent protease with MMP-like domain